jgi:hypothetical protein
MNPTREARERTTFRARTRIRSARASWRRAWRATLVPSIREIIVDATQWDTIFPAE